nr:meiosis inhibitor protein 1-like isoform X3 [Pelodiscus sinensis]|eukprot:XP_025039105.1 meiosis inhibitor protein 1-like isoform X3 [Pelodiscus sinensis]
MTLFVRYRSIDIISQSEISQILHEAAKAKLAELPGTTSHALRLFLRQLQSGSYQMEPAQEEMIHTLLESLPARTRAPLSHQDMVCLGRVAVSVSHIAD